MTDKKKPRLWSYWVHNDSTKAHMTVWRVVPEEYAEVSENPWKDSIYIQLLYSPYTKGSPSGMRVGSVASYPRENLMDTSSDFWKPSLKDDIALLLLSRILDD